MKTGIRTLAAVTAGMAVALALVVAVEWFSALVHPVPADFDGNIAEHVRRYPDWVLGVAVLAWASTAGVATWVAARLGNRLAGGLVTVLLALALAFNLTALPYPMWFKVVMSSVFPVACLLGVRCGGRRGQGEQAS